MGLQVFREEILAYTKAYMNLLRELQGIHKVGEGKQISLETTKPQ